MLRNPINLPNEGLSVYREWPNNAVMPVSLELVKQHLKVDYDNEDSLIQSYIDGIVWKVEQAYSIALVPDTTVTFTLNQLNKHVPFPIAPQVSVQSVLIDGTATTDYNIYGVGDGKYIMFTAATYQPQKQLQVNYTAGVEPSPEVKSLLLELIADAYEYRDSSRALLHTAFKALGKYRNMAYAA